MSNPAKAPSPSECFLVFKTPQGWVMMHPEHGECLIQADPPGRGEMWIAKDLIVDDAFVATSLESGDTYVIDSDADSIDEVKSNLLDDGYKKREIKKMNPHRRRVAYFV
jgi:hypothetical protein